MTHCPTSPQNLLRRSDQLPRHCGGLRQWLQRGFNQQADQGRSARVDWHPNQTGRLSTKARILPSPVNAPLNAAKKCVERFSTIYVNILLVHGHIHVRGMDSIAKGLITKGVEEGTPAQ
ncbi:hypothetical protein QBC36DRAFT_94988 [Triangularia setosa]|uniref:Uncharacterized protein n=1 Tax=Triangularia setosa TaxID=2587417 RepID=A0AAN7A147_9PEZI|nr:hypothetical protein QBC36DRAFT_94988 [Podospora setosa]